jgi:hypothetical protein
MVVLTGERKAGVMRNPMRSQASDATRFLTVYRAASAAVRAAVTVGWSAD